MFFPLSFLKDSFTRYRILGWQLFFFLSAFWVYHFTAFFPLLYLMRSKLLILLGQRVPCTWWIFLFLLFSRFPLSLSFSLTIMWLVVISLCLSYSLFVEFLGSLESCVYLIKLFKFSNIIYKNILLPLSLSIFPSKSPIIYMLVNLLLTHRSLKFCSFFFNHCALCYSVLIITTYLHEVH